MSEKILDQIEWKTSLDKNGNSYHYFPNNEKDFKLSVKNDGAFVLKIFDRGNKEVYHSEPKVSKLWNVPVFNYLKTMKENGEYLYRNYNNSDFYALPKSMEHLLDNLINTKQKMCFTWLPFFTELLDKIFQYDSKTSLVEKFYQIFSSDFQDQMPKGNSIPLEEIDPLTFIAMFNRGNTLENRIAYCQQAKEIFNLESSVPSDFDGIPVFNNQKTWFFNYKYSRDENIIDDLWAFASQINNGIELSAESFNKILSFPQIGLSKLSQFLFICNPEKYYPADSNSIQLIYGQIKRQDSLNFYSKYIADIKSSQYSNLQPYEYSKLAEKNRAKNKENNIEHINNKQQYWLYSAGKKSVKWEEFYNAGIMALGWDELGDLKKYQSKQDIGEKLREITSTTNSFKNDALANWEFTNKMGVGDIIFVKSGLDDVLIGRGIVSSDYIFDDSRQDYKSLRKVDWTHNREFKVNFNELDIIQWNQKTLTDVSEEKYGDFCYKIEKIFAIKDDKKMADKDIDDLNKKDVPLNQILLGPPGTGKTYETRKIIKDILQEQVDILNSQHNSNDELKIKEVVENLTWYDVIALAMYRNNKDSFKVKEISEFAELRIYHELKNCKQLNNTLWGQLQIHTGLDSKTVNYSNERRSEPFVFDKTENAEWYLTESGKKYVQAELADALNLLTANKKHNLEDFYKFITFHQSYSYEEFVEGLKPEVNEETGNITYNIENGIFKDSCKDARRDLTKGLKYVLVIDEINRGNISKIFGELITLIEDTKRIKLNPQEDDEGLEVTLPYSKQLFGVPENLYIVGTMNTADRSIALLDLALRRRFDFIPKYPDSSLIKDGKGKTEVNGINLESFLDAINERIEVLYDKDHTIGHSYLMGINDYSGFLKVFNNKILPLLQEYFYNDYEKIAKVLNQNDFEENKETIIHKAEVMGIPKYSINKLLRKDTFSPEAFKRSCLKND